MSHQECVGALIRCDVAGRRLPSLSRIIEVLRRGVIRVKCLDGGACFLLIRADKSRPVTYTQAMRVDGEYVPVHPFAEHEKRIGPYSFADEREAVRHRRRIKRQQDQVRLMQRWIPALDEEAAYRLVKRRRLRENPPPPEGEITTAQEFVEWIIG